LIAVSPYLQGELYIPVKAIQTVTKPLPLSVPCGQMTHTLLSSEHCILWQHAPPIQWYSFTQTTHCR